MNAPEPLPPLPFTDLKAQYAALRPRIDARMQRVLDHGQYIMGPEVEELEDAARRLRRHAPLHQRGQRHRGAADRADGARHRPGDEVITTPFTFAATAEMIVLLGATPVFVDVEPDTCNIDARADRGRDHAAHQGHHAGEPVRPGGRHGSHQRHRRAPRAGGDRGRGAELRRHLPGPAQLRPVAPGARPASSRASRWAATATAARSSPTTTRWRRRRARSACTARARATRTRASASAAGSTRCRPRCCWPSWSASTGSCSAATSSARATRNCWPACRGLRTLAVRPDRDCVWGQYTVFVDRSARRCRRRCRRWAFRLPCTTRGRCTASRPMRPMPAATAARVSEQVAEQVLSLPMSADLSHADQDRVVAALAAGAASDRRAACGDDAPPARRCCAPRSR